MNTATSSLKSTIITFIRNHVDAHNQKEHRLSNAEVYNLCKVMNNHSITMDESDTAIFVRQNGKLIAEASRKWSYRKCADLRYRELYPSISWYGDFKA